MRANDIDLAILGAAAATLRRRAQRQARIAQDGTTVGDRGAIFAAVRRPSLSALLRHSTRSRPSSPWRRTDERAGSCLRSNMRRDRNASD
jgi:hypothetical protein